MLQEANIIAKDDIRLINSMQNTSELILDYTHNPMKDRELSLLPSHSEIYYNFIHLPYQNQNSHFQNQSPKHRSSDESGLFYSKAHIRFHPYIG